MLIEIHMIQNHSPSNLNRDDLGAPKTCVFGGVTRARISSQCLKRSIRNPGNPDDVHKREPGIFATAMAGHIGTRTQFFPSLVERALLKSTIPAEEHPRIVLAAQRIAVSKEKEEKKKAASAGTDTRPRTAQLIHVGPGHAEFFVQQLVDLRAKDEESKKCYDYFLDPVVGFQEMVRVHLADAESKDAEKEKIVKASWAIAKDKNQMNELREEVEEGQPEPQSNADQRSEPQSATGVGQPTMEDAELIADRLVELRSTNEAEFKRFTKPPTKDEKKQDAPEKPKKGMEKFMAALKAVNGCDAVDIALFGRMTTSDAFEDVEGAMQVAHAISTHAAVNETDYWTALDDLAKTQASANLGEATFNSACFYKYFSLDWHQLLFNLAGPEPEREKDKHAYEEWAKKIQTPAMKLAAATLGHFIRAAAMTTPSGKQNSFASNCEPCGILVEIKQDGKTPTSYANAFAEPARKIGDPPDDAADYVSLVGRSIAQLGDHAYSLRRAYGAKSKVLWYSPQPWRYPLQGWERESDGRRAKVRNEKDEPIDKDKPPVQFADESFDVLGGQDGTPAGLVEAVVKEVSGLEWNEVSDPAKVAAKEP